jgi:DNA phosphorothioation-associated putative methyltransferase
VSLDLKKTSPKSDPNKRIGKRIKNALYIHRCAIDELDLSHTSLLYSAQRLLPDPPFTPNVFKLTKKPNRVSFLLYEDFETHPFPALLESISIDLEKNQWTAKPYRNSSNPPILHRKELLLPDSHPQIDACSTLTDRLVARGLFNRPHAIGHKKQWDDLLRAEGFDPNF